MTPSDDVSSVNDIEVTTAPTHANKFEKNARRAPFNNGDRTARTVHICRSKTPAHVTMFWKSSSSNNTDLLTSNINTNIYKMTVSFIEHFT